MAKKKGVRVEATIAKPDGKTVTFEVAPEAVLLRNGHVVFVDVPKGFGLEGGVELLKTLR